MSQNTNRPTYAQVTGVLEENGIPFNEDVVRDLCPCPDGVGLCPCGTQKPKKDCGCKTNKPSY
tara:strand:- start:3229 stop:3417 length:189 start_codon:yes stop_codon:yes gene_type:complete